MTQAFKTWMVATSLLLGLTTPLSAASDNAVLEVGLVASDQPFTARQVLRGDAGPWQARDVSRLHFAGDPAVVSWVRIKATLPDSTDDRWGVWIGRAWCGER